MADSSISETLPSEVTRIHTRLLRLALGVQESRAYWSNIGTDTPVVGRSIMAFEGRWFGAKSVERVRTLLENFSARYDAFPGALEVLRGWPAMEPQTRQLICHWHLQLSDPLYRRFTGEFLPARRTLPDAKIDRTAALRWVRDEFPERWSASTCTQFASKLLSATSEAGLISGKRDPRSVVFPKVPDVALAYLLYVLRGVRFQGSLVVNPYLASVGLEGPLFDARLRALPGMTFRRMGAMTEFDWKFTNVRAWAEATL